MFDLPRFPAAATTTIPAETSSFTFTQTGSLRYESMAVEPRLRFTIRMLYWFLFWSTQFKPFSSHEVCPSPLSPRTLTLRTLAPVAIPRYAPFDLPSLPAAILQRACRVRIDRLWYSNS